MNDDDILASSTVLDMENLREAAAELGYWPASTDDDHLAKLRAQNAHYDELFRQDPAGTKWQKMMGAPRVAQGHD